MNTLMYSYIFIFIGISVSIISGSKEVTPYVLVSTPNVDSDPDDNITELAELYSVEFKCDTEEIASLGEATNVNELKPSDVEVVAAIGDSMTAALFAKVKNVIGLIPVLFNKHSLEFRGVSWSIGGDEGATTLPNLIKHYNPNLQGYSVKTGKEGTANAAYNFAVSGAVASGLLEQATNLVDRIKSDSLNGKWKVVTLFIGGNDLCAMCEDTNTFSADNFYNNILKAIQKLSELDKVFINLVQTMEVTKVTTLAKKCGCKILQGLMEIIDKCSCVNNPITHEYHEEYQEKINQLEAFARKELDRDDFTVVVQPFFGITTMPKDPFGYFAPDCFHLSQKGLLNAAVALWNNMLEPVGGKTDELLVDQLIKCPTKSNPYFYTHKNSPSKTLGVEREEAGNNQGLSSGAIAGAIVGTLLAVSLIIVAAAVVGWFAYKRMKPRTFAGYESLN